MAEKTSTAAQTSEPGAKGARREAPPPAVLGLAGSLLGLQSTKGNRSVGRLIGGALLQHKLQIGPAGDAYEREADRMAEAVLGNGPAGPISEAGGGVQRMCHECEEELVQRMCAECQEEEEEELLQPKADGAPPSTASPAFEARLGSLRGSGRPLPADLQSFFEPRFGHDFGAVRVHTGGAAGEAAQAVRARAFTVGNDVVFGIGEWSPGTTSGKRLLAHELTHVVQQTPRVARSQPLLQRAPAEALKPVPEGTNNHLSAVPPPPAEIVIVVSGTLYDLIHYEWTNAAFDAIFKRIARSVVRRWNPTNNFERKIFLDLRQITLDLRAYDFTDMANSGKETEHPVELVLRRAPGKSWKDDYGFTVHCPWLEAAKAAGPPPTRHYTQPVTTLAPASPSPPPRSASTDNCLNLLDSDPQAFTECTQHQKLKYAEDIRKGAMSVTEPIAAGLEAINPLDPINLATGGVVGAVVKGRKVIRTARAVRDAKKRSRVFEWISRRQGSRGAAYWIEGDAAQFLASQRGHHVYEYLDEEGKLLYVGKSGGERGKRSWVDRLREDHINASWIGEARSVRVTHDLTEQEMWALEEVLIPTAQANLKAGQYYLKFRGGNVSANAASALRQPYAAFSIETAPVRSSR